MQRVDKPVPTEADTARFWTFVPRQPTAEGCLEWTGGKSSAGYGAFWTQGKTVGAHDAAFAIKYGKWPEGLACHECDNPPCVNADHLFDGTPEMNAKDCAYKGRGKRQDGVHNSSAKLSATQVRAIRDEYGSYEKNGAGRSHSSVSMTELGMKYGISKGQVQGVITKRTYKEIS